MYLLPAVFVISVLEYASSSPSKYNKSSDMVGNFSYLFNSIRLYDTFENGEKG